MQGDNDELVELVSRRKSQDPPAWVVWEALDDPARSTRSWSWFEPLDGEVLPSVLSSTRPHSVEWSSIWNDRPELRITFEIDGGTSGCSVTWRLLGRPDSLEPADLERRRYRLNQLINGQLRAYFDL